MGCSNPVLAVGTVDMLMLRDSPDCQVMQAQWAAMEAAKAARLTRSIGLVNYCESSLRCILEKATVKPAVNYVAGLGLQPSRTNSRQPLSGSPSPLHSLALLALTSPRLEARGLAPWQVDVPGPSSLHLTPDHPHTYPLVYVPCGDGDGRAQNDTYTLHLTLPSHLPFSLCTMWGWRRTSAQGACARTASPAGC